MPADAGNDEQAQTPPAKRSACECGRWARQALGKQQARVGRLRKEIAMLREIIAHNGCQHEIPQEGESDLERLVHKRTAKANRLLAEIDELETEMEIMP